MHIRDEMSEKVQELEEELTMALSELKKAKEANKHLGEVRGVAGGCGGWAWHGVKLNHHICVV